MSEFYMIFARKKYFFLVFGGGGRGIGANFPCIPVFYAYALRSNHYAETS